MRSGTYVNFQRWTSSATFIIFLPKLHSIDKNIHEISAFKPFSVLDFNGYLLLYGICLYTIDPQTLCRFSIEQLNNSQKLKQFFLLQEWDVFLRILQKIMCSECKILKDFLIFNISTPNLSSSAFYYQHECAFAGQGGAEKGIKLVQESRENTLTKDQY